MGETPFIEIGEEGSQELIFPDLSFSDGEKLVHLELFHRWHAGALRRRLEQVNQRSDLDLLIGIDRSLLRSSDFKAEVEANPYFKSRGFLFNDFPPISRLQTLLKNFEAKLF